MATQLNLLDLRDVPRRMLQLLDEMHADSPDRWIPRRAIFANWWLFTDTQAFHFGRGNLMLTGRNESGKTSVLVAILTLVLDRILYGHRIDTTGDPRRSVRYYLLGLDDATPDSPYYHEERTGYVALEFEKGNSGQFLTIGIALRANRNWSDRRVLAWSFVDRSGRRIGIDWNLIKSDTGLPLTRNELKEALGNEGQVFDHGETEAYQVAVNEALFGFPTLDAYQQYLNTLITVRRPISMGTAGGLDPDKITAILVESLPTIDMAPIENASDSFTRMDTIEAEIRRMNEQRDFADKLDDLQIKALEAYARVDARAYLDAVKTLKDAEKVYNKKLADLDQAQKEKEQAQNKLEALKNEQAEIDGRLLPLKARYEEHEAVRVEENLNRALKELQRARSELEALENDRKQIGIRQQKLEEEVRLQQERWSGATRHLRDKIDDLATEARKSYWHDLGRRASDALANASHWQLENDQEIADELLLATIVAEAQERIRTLQPILKAHQRLIEQKKECDRLTFEAQEARRVFADADRDYKQSLGHVDTARSQAFDAIMSWHGSLRELRVPNDRLEAVTEQLISWDTASSRRGDQIFDVLQDLYNEAREALIEERDRTRFEENDLKRRESEIRAEIVRLEQTQDLMPPRSAEQEKAREALAQAEIPCLPLYEACDFRFGKLPLADQVRIEEALSDAMLLDALVVPRSAANRVAQILGDEGLGDRWIRPESSAAINEWLVVADGVDTALSPDDIQAALNSIGCGLQTPQTLAVDRSGAWRTGNLEGRAVARYDRVRFIGAANRKLERERRLQEQRARLDEVLAALQHVQESLVVLDRRLRQLEQEWDRARKLPELAELDRQLTVLRVKAEALQTAQNKLAQADLREREGLEKLAQARQALDDVVDAAPYTRNRSYEEVQSIERSLQTIPGITRDLVRALQALKEIRLGFSSIRKEQSALLVQNDQFMGRISAKNTQIVELAAEVASWQKQFDQKSAGREELAREIGTLTKRREEIQSAIRHEDNNIVRFTTTIDHIQPEIQRLEGHVRSARIAVEEARIQLDRRLRLYPALEGYVHEATTSGWDTLAETILAGTTTNTDLEMNARIAQNELNTAFHRYKEVFAGLGPRFDPQTGLIWFSTQEGELRASEMRNNLEEELAKKSLVRDEQDRLIIEKVFLRDLTEAVRKAIQETQQWVREINKILENMNMFRGRVLRLNWRVRKKTDADAYDPAELDELFQRRGIALRDEDQQKLVDIFRGMIDDIRRRSQDRDESVNYREALTEMLDYKRWYVLTIERREEAGGRFLPLTRKRYAEGSVGRKTLDLLLPLIAAVNARLNSARPDAPRLIGFDEAFAGVDDANAAIIYRLLADLEMSWIMATEKATTYGEHVPGVVTYEFISDGSVVVPLATVWDGRFRHSFEYDEVASYQTMLQPHGGDA